MDKPHRVQLRRTKGWRMPENTVKVARPTKWGNPYPIAASNGFHPREAGYTRPQAVLAFKIRMTGLIAIGAVDLTPLRGKNLACFCALDQPCHADVLLELANTTLNEPTP